MKKNIKLPTLFGVIVLVFGLIAGIYMINSRQEFKLSADVEAIPKNIRISNISNSSITVTWTTDIESNGFLKWGTSTGTVNKVVTEENSNKNLVHSAEIVDIETNKDVFFKIYSENREYDNNGVPWQSKTLQAKNNPNSSLISSGLILQQDGTSPASALVYITIDGILLSDLTSSEGSFIIPVSSYIVSVPETTAIEISVNAGNIGTSQAIIYQKSIKSIPTMIIGKTYDFRSLEVNNSGDLPESSLTAPQSIEISSRFEVDKEKTIDVKNVTLDSIKDGEIITTTDPDFFGVGPQDTSIEISVESELQEAVLSTDSKGKWNWSPPVNLEQGDHKITLKWRDANGVLRTITKSFVVAASEGPAFESTPSATPLVESATPSPSSTPATTPTVVATAKSTAAPTPETGSLLPTVGLFIMGLGILLSSHYIWNKSNAY